MSRVRWLGQLWYSTCMICTAVSVLPVPGGPTTIVSPGCVPALMASTCARMLLVSAVPCQWICRRTCRPAGMMTGRAYIWSKLSPQPSIVRMAQ